MGALQTIHAFKTPSQSTAGASQLIGISNAQILEVKNFNATTNNPAIPGVNSVIYVNYAKENSHENGTFFVNESISTIVSAS